MDETLRGLYATHLGEIKHIALFAVGGYGRAELHPGSDIDILVVANKPTAHSKAITTFLQNVFDLNLEVGHAVRDLKSCRNEFKQDITVATAMFERRFLCGDEKIAQRLDKTLNSNRLWPPDKFFAAKFTEQQQRHKDYDNNEYNLEPNVKTSPGGLRDIHTALWICRRQFGTTDPVELARLGVLTEEEKDWLIEGRRFIWWVRFGLHLVAGRKEDRLQFSHQRDLAQRLGFVDTDAQRGVERFMHHYYRHVLALREVNDILIQQFQEKFAKKKVRPKPINERFQLANDYIELVDEELVAEQPSTLLELFVVMANTSGVVGVGVGTIRAIRKHLSLIDDEFRQNPAHNELFMQILKAPYTLVTTLTRMRRYGVLGRYIPEYGRVIGQMQHDLFHIYTVDAHTMMVIRNMRRFRYRSSESTFPIAFHCVHAIPKIELLYIAGLYHDIGKGRGGDHSLLGAQDARVFCQRHNLSATDTDLVCWLVDKHLFMSSVSQREDIYDPEVVHRFATEVKSEMRLKYLYALTVADINATNPTLWNSWRATLLRQLFTETRRVLRRGLETPQDRDAAIAAQQEKAMERLLVQKQGAGSDHPPQQAAITQFWQKLGDDFFLRHTPREVVRLSKRMLSHDLESGPLIMVADAYGQLAGEGATIVYIYTVDRPQLFARTVVALSDFDLSVVDASIHTDTSGVCFDMFAVINQNGEALDKDSKLRERLIDRVCAALITDKPNLAVKKRRLPRNLREMPRRTEVTITANRDTRVSTLTVVASDRPGLLATIGLLFIELELRILGAKITTLGERVEDTFTIQSADGEAIAEGEATYMLQETIRQRIEASVGK